MSSHDPAGRKAAEERAEKAEQERDHLRERRDWWESYGKAQDEYRASAEARLREAEEALRACAWPEDVVRSHQIARAYFAAQETNDPPPPRDSGISSA